MAFDAFALILAMLALAVATFASYALARLDFRGKGVVAATILGGFNRHDLDGG